MLFALPGTPKGLHFGGPFGSHLELKFDSLWDPCFEAGQPAEIPILPSFHGIGPGPGVRKVSPAPA